MAVAHDAYAPSHTGSSSSTSETSFSWTHTPVGTPKGVLVFVFLTAANSTYVTGVTYGSSTLTRISAAQDATTEPQRCELWFLGSAIPTGAQTVVVSRLNNFTNITAASITVTATGDTSTAGEVLLQNDGTLAEQSVNDASPGSNSVRYAGLKSALDHFVSSNGGAVAGANSTFVHTQDFGADIAGVVRETTAGQGARSVGFVSLTTEDRAGIHIAVTDLGGGGGGLSIPVAMAQYRQRWR